MKNLKFTLTVSLFLFALFSQLGCSRSGGSSSLRFGVPLDSIDLGSLVTGAELDFLLINLRVPGHPLPLHAECDFGGNDDVSDPTAGESDIERLPISCNLLNGYVEVIIDSPPADANLMVQVLTVYRSTTDGSMDFRYGDVTVNTAAGVDTVANIVTVTAGTSSKEGAVSGRYLTAASAGPTGELQTYFAPPAGQPEMLVEMDGIVNGWFNIFLLDVNELTFKVRQPDGTSITLFDHVTLSSPQFDTSGGDAYRMTVSVPAGFRKDRDSVDGSSEAVIAQDAIVGYFGPDSSLYSAMQVCYSNHPESLSDYFTDATLTTPMVWEGGSVGSGVVVTGGGMSMTTESMYLTCDMSTGNYINFIHAAIDGHVDDAVGFSGLLIKEDLTARWSDPVKADFDGANTISLSWAMLPGTDTINGNPTQFEVFVNPASSNSGGGNFDCFAPEAGYVSAGSVAISTESFTYTAGVNSSNYYDHKFALCPFFIGAAGEINNLGGRAFEVHCIGGCGDDNSLGRALPATITLGGAANITDGSFGGGFLQMDSDPTVSGNMTTVSFDILGDQTNFAADDEMMIMVMASRGTGCGTHQGQSIGAGQYTFARIIGKSSPNMTIKSGTFVDSLAATSWTAATSANHCNVQFIKVVEVNNLVIPGFTVTGQSAAGTGFFFDYNGGGAVVLRSNGTITLDDFAVFDVSAAGYGGGESPNWFGSGPFGSASAGFPGTGGGENDGSLEGSGGSGFGAGGDSSNFLGASGFGGFGWIEALYGSGGGYAGGSSVGGSGGGFIFISAKHIVNNSNATAPEFKANGGAGVGSTYGSGGGGGGSINLMFRTISSLNSQTINMFAQGGNGGPGSGVPGGGGGGGGRVNVFGCEGNLADNSQFFMMANQGTFGGGTPSANSGSPGSENYSSNMHCD